MKLSRVGSRMLECIDGQSLMFGRKALPNSLRRLSKPLSDKDGAPLVLLNFTNEVLATSDLSHFVYRSTDGMMWQVWSAVEQHMQSTSADQNASPPKAKFGGALNEFISEYAKLAEASRMLLSLAADAQAFGFEDRRDKWLHLVDVHISPSRQHIIKRSIDGWAIERWFYDGQHIFSRQHSASTYADVYHWVVDKESV